VLVKSALLTGSLVTGIRLINWLHGICQAALPPSVILWAIIWQLCVWLSLRVPLSLTEAPVLQPPKFITAPFLSKSRQEKHSLKDWKYPW